MKNNVITINDIAELVLSKISCTAAKLERLVYFCYIDYEKKTAKKLFSETPKNYLYPCVPTFETLRKKYGRDDKEIIQFDRSPASQNDIQAKFSIDHKTLKIFHTCSEIIKKYGKYTTAELINLTPRTDTYWRLVMKVDNKPSQYSNYEYRHMMDFAENHFAIFQEEADIPILFINEDMPNHIREKLNEVWPKVVEETIRRHRNDGYSSIDYFM